MPDFVFVFDRKGVVRGVRGKPQGVGGRGGLTTVSTFGLFHSLHFNPAQVCFSTPGFCFIAQTSFLSLRLFF